MELSDEELERYTSQIEGVIRYLDKLDNISLADIESNHLRKMFTELREDQDRQFDGEVLGTRYRKEGFVKGPRMV